MMNQTTIYADQAEPLTDREMAVLKLLHLSDKEIGLSLGKTLRCIEKNVANIRSKFGVPNRTSAAMIWTIYRLTRSIVPSIYWKDKE